MPDSENNNIGNVIFVDKSKTPIDIITARDIVCNFVQERLLYYYNHKR